MSDQITATCKTCHEEQDDCVNGECFSCSVGEYWCACGNEMTWYEMEYIGVCKECR